MILLASTWIIIVHLKKSVACNFFSTILLIHNDEQLRNRKKKKIIYPNIFDLGIVLEFLNFRCNTITPTNIFSQPQKRKHFYKWKKYIFTSQCWNSENMFNAWLLHQWKFSVKTVKPLLLPVTTRPFQLSRKNVIRLAENIHATFAIS